MSDFEIRALKENEYSLWDDFVEKSPQGSIFSSSVWLRVLSNAKDGKAEIIGVFNKNELVSGILTFVRKKGPFKVVAYPPLTPFTSILFKESATKKLSKVESQQKEVCNLMAEYFVKRHNYVALLLDPTLIDIRPFLWSGWKSSVNYTYEVDLSNMDELWGNLEKDAKYEVSKGRDFKLAVSEGSDISDFYELYEKTFSKQHMPAPIKKDFIVKMFDILHKENKCKLYCATTKEKEIIASALVIWDARKPYYLLAASNPEIKQSGPSFLLWTIFEDMSKRFKVMDLVGANTPHIVKFKRKFASKLIPYYLVEKYRPRIVEHLISFYKYRNYLKLKRTEIK